MTREEQRLWLCRGRPSKANQSHASGNNYSHSAGGAGDTIRAPGPLIPFNEENEEENAGETQERPVPGDRRGSRFPPLLAAGRCSHPTAAAAPNGLCKEPKMMRKEDKTFLYLPPRDQNE